MVGSCQQGAAAQGLGNCVSWISTTKPVFENGPVCLTLSKTYPDKDFNAKNTTPYAFKYGHYSKVCACPPKV